MDGHGETDPRSAPDPRLAWRPAGVGDLYGWAALIARTAAVEKPVWKMSSRLSRSLLGRVSSLDWFISTGLVPLSFAIVAPVTAAIGARNTFLVAGGVGAAVTLGFLFVPGVRSADLAAEPTERDTELVLAA